MQAWVTGGSGFVGSNVVAELAAAGDLVHCAVHERIPRCATSWGRVDLLDPAAVRADMERVEPDARPGARRGQARRAGRDRPGGRRQRHPPEGTARQLVELLDVPQLLTRFRDEWCATRHQGGTS